LRDTFYNISSSVTELRRKLPKLGEKIASYEQRVNTIKTNHEQIRHEITSAIATLMNELKHRETALLTEAEVHMQSQFRYMIQSIIFFIYSFLGCLVCNKKQLKLN
jgi:DNA-binding ferritin-like protein